MSEEMAGKQFRRQSCNSRWLFSMLLTCFFIAGQVWANEPATLTLQDFRSGFESAFAKKDVPAMKTLAGEHPEKLRLMIEENLSEFSSASSESRTVDAEKAYDLAAAAAGLSQELFDDPFPANQVRLYRSWKRDEHLMKIKADVFLRQTRVAFDEGRYGDVHVPGRSALEIYTVLKDEAGQGKALHYMGQADRRLANYPDALSLHHQALVLATQASDRLHRGLALIDIGDVHERKKEPETAIKFYTEALQILKSPADWKASALALRQLGDVYVATGRFENAYGAYNQALQHAEKAKDMEHVAEFNDYIGFCHRRLGDYRMAIGYHQIALESAKMIVSTDVQLRAHARSLNHLGLCTSKIAEEYVTEGNSVQAAKRYSMAIAYEEEALGLAVKVADRWRQGYVLRALSLMHRERGALFKGQEAIQAFQLSLGRADEAYELGVGMKEKEWQGLALHDRALALVLLNREQEGLKTFQQALDLWEQMGDLQSAGYAHRFVARQFHEARGRLAEAEASYDRAILAFVKIGDIESQGFAMLDKARVQALRGQKESAAILYDQGISKLETVRTKAGFPEFRKAFMGKIYDRYEEAALFALGNGFKERALLYVESMKARTFLDQLAEGRVEVEKGIDRELKVKRDKLESAISAETDKISEELRKPSPDGQVLALSRAKVENLSVELNRLIKQIRLQNPQYASVRYPVPVTVAELQGKVLSKEEVLLEYFITSQGIFCFIVTTDTFEIVKLAVGEADLHKRVEELLENIKSSPARGEGYDRISAGQLYDILLKPFEDVLEGRPLMIVPDGILARLPFEALVIVKEGKRTYLLEKNVVKYIQSASVLALLRTHGNSAQASERFIGFGDPVYDYENFKRGKQEGIASVSGRGIAGLGVRLGRLEASGDEIRAIKQLFPKKKMMEKTFLREEARKDYAKGDGMDQYGYIHFSMHGIVTPRLQAIAFSQIPGAGDDCLLTVNEIMNLHYNARLVVLSACQTGLGRSERGEGVTGLTRAVMYAGSAATVVSLWNVDDTATRDLMTWFYKGMIQEKVGKADALRRAKQKLLKTQYRHPYFWAAFVMYGE
jgi:CHAT domain-containing protein/predicted negative regulator of RcsB-dependent stress response